MRSRDLDFSQTLTLTRQLCRKLRMRWFFEVFKVKESSFFNHIILYKKLLIFHDIMRQRWSAIFCAIGV